MAQEQRRQTYQYPSGTRRGQIRLLRLIPHNDNKSPIECTLFLYTLNSENRRSHLYEALSYTWGSPELTHSISVDGDFFPVAANLYRALERLRDAVLERILWIDAICINQADDAEKSQQVQAMSMVYAYASRVIVWLGDLGEQSEWDLAVLYANGVVGFKMRMRTWLVKHSTRCSRLGGSDAFG